MRAPGDSPSEPGDALDPDTHEQERDHPTAQVKGEPGPHPLDPHSDQLELTFVTADPPRDSWFALWHPAGIAEPDAVVALVRPEGGHDPTPRGTPVHRIELDEAIEALLGPTTGTSASLATWAAVARTAVSLIARGRLRPGLAQSGADAWRIAGLTAEEQSHLAQLAAAMPAAAYCATSERPGADSQPNQDQTIGDVEMATAPPVIAAALDAIADRFLRTAAAPVEAGHRAFAALEPTTIDSRTALLRLEALSGDRPPLMVLRLSPPDYDGGSFSASLIFQSRRDQALTVPAEALWTAPDEIRQRFRNVENGLLITLRRAARVWAPLTTLLDQHLPTSIQLSESEVEDLAGPIANELGAAGLSVLWPAGLIGHIDLRPVVGSAPDAPEIALTGRTTRLDLASLLELRWQGMVDGQMLDAAELRELAEAKRSVIRLRGQWVRVEADQLQRLSERRKVGATTALAVALGGTATVDGVVHEIQVDGPLATLGERLQNHDSQRRMAAPPSMNVELRPYQERGLAWLAEMDELGLGGVLADDMGLGKTVQILGLHVHRQTSRPSPTLVICPTSVVGNWERETNRFAPGTPVVRYHGTRRSLDDVGPNTILLTSYGIARRDAARLAKISWGLVVADEAQNIKNPTSRTARAMRTIPADTRFALTGTPVQNQLSDLWALLDWTTPGLLGPLDRFRRDLAGPIERDGDPETTQTLSRLLRPFLLRRRKSDPDIAPDLPPKTETDEVVPLTAEQATLYQAVVDEVMAEIALATGIERRGLVLRLVTRLKQVCNHPVHLLGENDDLDGKLANRSGKLTATADLLQVITEEGEAALVFTQYVTMGRLLEKQFKADGYRTLFLHGGLGVRQREAMVESFQAGEADVFVVSLKAGGTGLNLTAATHVIHYDRWWNPAVEDQASDRAWRIGQDRPVQIHRLICEGTIEDRIAALLRDKRAVADAVVGAGEGWISELTDADLADLVALGEQETDG